MTKAQAKEVIELMFKGRTVLPKDDVLKIIDMIDDTTYVKTVEYPIVYPSYPSYPYHPIRWWESWTCSDNSNINLCTSSCTNTEARL